MKRNLWNVIFDVVFFFVKQKQRNKARKNNKNKEGQKNKKARKEKSKKQERERQRAKKEKWKKPRKKGRHWEMNKITRVQGKTMFCKWQKTQKTKKGSRPTAPKTRAIVFCSCPFGLLMVTYRLRKPCSLQKCHSPCFLLLSVFCFVFFGCVSFFVSIFVFIVLFVFDSVVSLSCIFSLCDPKNQIKSQNIWNVHFDVLLWCLHPCTLTWPS